MGNELVVASNSLALREEITEAKIMEYLDSAGITNSLLENEKKMFLNIAREFSLNPFKREIHITAYGEGKYRKCSIITGYEVYIKRAERTGKLDGWKVWTEGEGKSMKAVVEIYRRDMKYPFTHEAYYSECVQYTKEGNVNAIWAKQPRFMTKKVAIGQAFRLCFPDDLGGMPYEEVEIPQEEPRNVTDETNGSNSVPQTPPAEPPSEGAPPPPPADVQKPESKKIVDVIVAVMTAKTPDFTDFFTDEERQNVKNKILETNGDIEKLKEIAAVCERELERLREKYQPIPFSDDEASPIATDEQRAQIAASIAKDLGLKPASAATQKTTTAMPTAAADDGFVDDIPGQEEQVPAMFEIAELDGPEASEALDIF